MRNFQGTRNLWIRALIEDRAIVTRNAESGVKVFIEHLCQFDTRYTGGGGFACILTRSFTPFKPHPAAVHHICEQWGVPTNNVVFVGDGRDDMVCGREAGAMTVLLRNNSNGHLSPLADTVVDSLHELVVLFRAHLSPSVA